MSFDVAVSVMLPASVAYDPAGLVAPSYAGWLTDPPHGTLPGGRFVARRQAAFEVAVFQREIAVPPQTPPSGEPIPSTSIPSAAIASAPAPAPVPLPPKRLAALPGIVLASLAPLPPRRPVAPMSYAPQTLAMPEKAALEEAAPDDATPPRDDTAGEEVPAPTEDAARPIDDDPESVASRATSDRAPRQIEVLIERYAGRFNVPVALVRRVAWRESKFDPSRRHGPYWGLMQIRVDTARALGFRGAPRDLLDAETNMAYAVAYLANAYRVAGRDERRAVTLYASGYYYEAKRKGMLGSLIRTAAAEE
ncbi:hypothetical protein GCM10028812_27190 [Ancylobacter sonchi]